MEHIRPCKYSRPWLHRYNFVLIILSITLNFKSLLQSLKKYFYLHSQNDASIIARGISKNEKTYAYVVIFLFRTSFKYML